MDKKVKMELSLRLAKALQILNSTQKDSEILTEINKHITKPISRGYLSKLKNVSKNEKYINEVNIAMFGKIYQIIDPIIAKNFKQAWNDKTKKYQKNLNFFDNRINGLCAVWKGFSWNKRKSEIQENPEKQYINIFKLNIITPENIIAKTENGNFIKGQIHLINNDRIIIELQMNNRQAFYVALTGVNQNLEDINILKVCYSDTGDKSPKVGLAVLKRTSELFEEIKVESKELKSFENTDEFELVKNLPNTQLKLS